MTRLITYYCLNQIAVIVTTGNDGGHRTEYNYYSLDILRASIIRDAANGITTTLKTLNAAAPRDVYLKAFIDP